MRAQEFITETFSPGKDWKWSFMGSREAVAVFYVGEIPYQFYAHGDNGEWEVSFMNAKRGGTRGTKFGLTGTGNSIKVISTVVDIMREFLRAYQGKLKELRFTADEPSRQALYARMVARLIPTWKLIQNEKEFSLISPEQIDEEDDDGPIRIKIGGNQAAKAWIDKVYAMYPQMMQGNHVMTWGSGDDLQFAMFELTPSFSKRGAVEVKWIQAYPLRQGVGSRAMKELQRLAQEDNITLTLFPWDKGQVSQSNLTKFYRGQGFKPTAKGSKNMAWTPSDLAESKLVDLGIDNLKLNVSIDGASVDIRVMNGDAQIGYVYFERDGKDLTPGDLAIDADFQRLGIASKLYSYVKSLGFNIRASDDQTQAGQAFWKKHRGEERVWEQTEVVDEAPLPADWDPAQYQQGTTFKSRLAYALERAKKLGTGSSRVATTIEYQGRPTVLKIAKNQKGLAQNSVEADILSDGYARLLGILIPIIDYDEQNREPTWVHTEMAQKVSEKQLCSLIKCDNLHQLVNMAYSITGRKKFVGPYQSYITHMQQKGMSEQDIETMADYANTLADLNSQFDVELGDFARAANWGLYNGKPVIIDVGFNSNVLNQYYKK